MAIQTEINRINQAKEDLKNSINAKLTDTQITNETIDNYSSFVDKISLSEDLSNELNEQTTLLTSQETIINNIIQALQDKISGGGTTEIWTITLTDDSVITKEVVIK